MFADHYPAVLAYARRRAPSHAADVTSEVFLTAWRRLRDVPDDSLPWLLGVARRVIANSRRADARAATVEMDGAGIPARRTDDTADDTAEDVADRAAVLDAFRALSDADREVLMLTAWDGLSAARAASVLDCSVTAFHVRLHRARARLARAFEAGQHPEPGRSRKTADER